MNIFCTLFYCYYIAKFDQINGVWVRETIVSDSKIVFRTLGNILPHGLGKFVELDVFIPIHPK